MAGTHSSLEQKPSTKSHLCIPWIYAKVVPWCRFLTLLTEVCWADVCRKWFIGHSFFLCLVGAKQLPLKGFSSLKFIWQFPAHWHGLLNDSTAGVLLYGISFCEESLHLQDFTVTPVSMLRFRTKYLMAINRCCLAGVKFIPYSYSFPWVSRFYICATTSAPWNLMLNIWDR